MAKSVEEVKTETAIQAALKELETVANLSLAGPTRKTIARAVKVLTMRIAELEQKCRDAFDAGWTACDQAHEELSALPDAESTEKQH